MRGFKWHRRSIFWKLLIVFALSGIIINVMVFWGMRRIGQQSDPEGPFRRHLQYYGELLVREMGNPPDPVKISAVEDRLDMRIRIESPDGWVYAGSDLPSWEVLRANHLPLFPGGIPVSRVNGRPFFLFEHEGIRYAFFAPHEVAARQHNRIMITSIVALSLVLLVAWLALRRVLNPVKQLAAGIERMSQGDLDVTVPVRKRGRDEFNLLVESFNSMVGRIKEFIRSREQLLADVSHELRSPLTRMKVALEMIPPSASRESVAQDVREMEETISLILDSARFATGQMKLDMGNQSLKMLVDETLPLTTTRGKHIETGGIDPKVTARCDARWTKVVLRNILENALTHGKGNTPESKVPVQVSTEVDGQNIYLIVRDYGPGIPASEMERVFEPFHRLDPSRQRTPDSQGGLGLGLHLCLRIAEAQGGKLSISQGHPSGTVVRLTLPM